MKHIKEYTYYSKIDELSDYLQEIFDKLNIIESDGRPEGINSWYKSTMSTKAKSYIPIIDISMMTTELYYDLKDSLIQIRPNIEKRLGLKISIMYFVTSKSISISLTPLRI